MFQTTLQSSYVVNKMNSQVFHTSHLSWDASKLWSRSITALDKLCSSALLIVQLYPLEQPPHSYPLIFQQGVGCYTGLVCPLGLSRVTHSCGQSMPLQSDCWNTVPSFPTVTASAQKLRILPFKD